MNNHIVEPSKYDAAVKAFVEAMGFDYDEVAGFTVAAGEPATFEVLAYDKEGRSRGETVTVKVRRGAHVADNARWEYR